MSSAALAAVAPGAAASGAAASGAAVSGAAASAAAATATVFGLDVRAEIPLAMLARARAAPTGRSLPLRLGSTPPRDPSWRREARTICTRRRPDGSVYFRIETHPRAGHLIWGERRGSFLLAADGQSLLCTPDTRVTPQWERFLVAQVLPFAALVRGLEIFHASAVVLDGRAFAFVGSSGAGKTSLALALCDRGARFLADDVLALQPWARGLIAHAGTPAAGVDHREAERLQELRRPLTGERLGSDAREQVIAIEGARGAAPLGGLFLLDRRADGSAGPRFRPAVDARMLLACTFNFVLDTPRRMQGLLQTCALAARGRVERVIVTPATDAGALAAAVLGRLQACR